MKSDEKLLAVLNKILVEELEHVNSTLLHSKRPENLDDVELFEQINEIANRELKQAEWLIRRIIFLELLKTHQPASMTSKSINTLHYKSKKTV